MTANQHLNAFLKAHYGFTLRKHPLASGAFSSVYQIAKNKVLKLSTDPYWYLCMKHLHRKKCQHLPQFLVDHGVIGEKEYEFFDENDQISKLMTPVYAVVMPKYKSILTLPRQDAQDIVECFDNNLRSLTSFSKELIKTRQEIKKFSKLSKKSLRAMAKKESLNSWVTELNIDLCVDLHEDNLMVDMHNDIILLDPICCNTYHSEV